MLSTQTRQKSLLFILYNNYFKMTHGRLPSERNVLSLHNACDFYGDICIIAI